jgi:hypothetical protein
MTKLFLYGAFAGEQAQFGAMEAGTEQLIDRILKVFRTVEDPNRFMNGAAL